MASQIPPAATNERIVRLLEEVKAQLADSNRRQRQIADDSRSCTIGASRIDHRTDSWGGWVDEPDRPVRSLTVTVRRRCAHGYALAMELVRDTSDLGSWEMATRAPAPRLRPWVRPWVRRLGAFAERTRRPLCRREVPSGELVMIIDLARGWQISGPVYERPAHHGSFVAGLTDGPALVAHDGEARCIQVDLSPLGARRLFGVPMNELSNRVVDLDDVLGPSASELAERLDALPRWEQRLDLVEDVLGARILAGAQPSPGVAWAWRMLETTHGRARIGALAAELGWSHRRLIERFRGEVGIAPKALAQILRFQRVAQSVRDEPSARWAELAWDCGYADQAHLVRDFRRFAGVTPTVYAASLLPDGVGVNFVQDERARAA